MDIEVYVCDSPEALAQTLGALSGRAQILYTSPDSSGETGEVLRYLVRPPRSAGKTLERFTDKLLVVARRV